MLEVMSVLIFLVLVVCWSWLRWIHHQLRAIMQQLQINGREASTMRQRIIETIQVEKR